MMSDIDHKTEHHPQAAVRRSKVPWIVAAVALVVAAGALLFQFGAFRSDPAAAAPTPTETPAAAQQPVAPSFTMSGAFDIFEGHSVALKDGQACGGTDPDSKPIGDTTEVNVYNSDGKVLATGFLSQGKYVAEAAACVFRFSVDDVPDGLPGYGVEVGSYGVQQVSSTTAHSNVFLSEGP